MDSTTKFADAAEAAGIRRKMFYSVREVAQVCGVPQTTIRYEIRSGRMRCMLPEGRRQGRLIRPEWVDEWAEEGSRA